MSGLFNPKAPNIPKVERPPAIDDAQVARDAADRLLRRRGRGSTILTGSGTTASAGTTKLLGGG